MTLESKTNDSSAIKSTFYVNSVGVTIEYKYGTIKDDQRVLLEGGLTLLFIEACIWGYENMVGYLHIVMLFISYRYLRIVLV